MTQEQPQDPLQGTDHPQESKIWQEPLQGELPPSPPPQDPSDLESPVVVVQPVVATPYPTENPWLEGLKTIGLSVILALGIRTFVAEARYIPSGSMLPTLEIDDRLIIDKVSYRFFESPNRGDIVVFEPTDELRRQKFKDAFIKRVIGLPGESIEVRDNRVFVNGKELKEVYISDRPDYRWGPETVPQGQYLVLGDNRNNSYDSHYWGFVPRDRIIGRAVVRIWPPNRLGGMPDPNYKP